MDSPEPKLWVVFLIQSDYYWWNFSNNSVWKHILFALILGAGKTFTMLGTDREPGIMARTLNDLFDEMDKTKEDMKYKVSMSYLEVSYL